MAALAMGLFGSVIGSFLNVVVYRVPEGRSIVSPPSACGNCGHAVRAYDNIPLISWIVLRGRCRDCATPISVRYPLVELAAGMLFVFVGIRFVPSIVSSASGFEVASGVVATVAYLYLASISLVLALIDLDTHRLPNTIVLPAYGVGAVLLSAASIISGDLGALVSAGLGALIMGGVYLLLAVLRPGGMGAGDVKLAGALGLFLGWLGWNTLVVGLLAGFILGGLFGVLLLVVRRANGKTGIPFGPWMLAGAWVGIFFGRELAAGYLSLFGLGGS